MLHTKRLDLVVATPEHIRCELQHLAGLASLLGASVSEEWPPGEYDRGAMEFFLSKLETEGAKATGWYLWYAIARACDEREAQLVAAAGFLGPPCEGIVEIGFSVIPSARNQKVATETVTALVAYAMAHSDVTEVLAHTMDTNIASTKVLLACGFERIGPEGDPEMIRYRFSPNRSAVAASG